MTSYGEDVGFNELDTFCEETLGAEVMGLLTEHLDRRTDRSEAANGSETASSIEEAEPLSSSEEEDEEDDDERPLSGIKQAHATIDLIEAEIAELAATGDGGDRVGRARQQKELKDGKVQAVMELNSQYQELLAVLEDSLAGESAPDERLRAMAAALRKAKDRCKAKAKEYRVLRNQLKRSIADATKRHNDVTVLEDRNEAANNDRKQQYDAELEEDEASRREMEADLLQRMQELRHHNQTIERKKLENSAAERTFQAIRTACAQTKKQATGALPIPTAAVAQRVQDLHHIPWLTWLRTVTMLELEPYPAACKASAATCDRLEVVVSTTNHAMQVRHPYKLTNS